MTWMPLIAGIVLLIACGELPVRGVVQAGLNGSPGIAYGDIVGSDIANIRSIGGISALICPVVLAEADCEPVFRDHGFNRLCVRFVGNG